MIFIRGDVSEGSENDTLLKTIIGPNWKVLTGADQPIHSPGASPGYKHDEYWPTVIARAEERKKRKEEIQKEYGISIEINDGDDVVGDVSNQVNEEEKKEQSLPLPPSDSIINNSSSEEVLSPSPPSSTNEES